MMGKRAEPERKRADVHTVFTVVGPRNRLSTGKTEHPFSRAIET